jgi:glycerate kinase
MNSLRIVIAPSGYKECLLAEDVAAAIARGVRRATDNAEIVEIPLVDGGEGFVRTLIRLTGGSLHEATVSGPVGQPVIAVWGMLGGAKIPTAVIEMAAAGGLALVPRDRRNPLRTTTFGVGQLILAALDAGARRILLGCGDSGTNDGGAGMAQALGIRMLDRAAREICTSGAGLLDLVRIDRSALDQRIANVPIEVACNIKNLLCGPRGVARVYGPQKGASRQTIAHLEKGLERFAAAIEAEYGIDVREMPGGGASGGLGAGLHAFLGAKLCPRYDVVSRYVSLDSHLKHADLVFTAEGGIDRQSVCGKMPSEIGMRAQRLGVPVIALAGQIGENAEVVHGYGIGAYFSTVSAPCPLSKAMAQASEQIERCAENVMRTVLLSMKIGAARAPARYVVAAA